MNDMYFVRYVLLQSKDGINMRGEMRWQWKWRCPVDGMKLRLSLVAAMASEDGL
jgi:hypothetical protein